MLIISEFRKDITWIYQFYLPLKRRLIIIVLLSIVVALLSSVIPYTFIRIIDGIESSLSMRCIGVSILILLGLSLLNFIFSVRNTNYRALTNLELEWYFRQNIFARLIKLDQTFYDKFRLGDLVTRLTDDVGYKLSWFACSGVFRAWESLLKILFSLVAMCYINPYLSLIAIIPLPIQIVIFSKSRNILDKRFKHLQQVISRVNETIENCFSGIRIIQAYCMEHRQAEKFASVASERVDAEISAEKAHIFIHSLYHYFWQISQILVLLTGGWLVINGKLTIGEFVAFDYYIGYLVWPMFDISGLLVGYRRASVSIKRLRELDEFTSLIQSPEKSEKPEKVTGHLVFRDVTFRRDNKCILHRVSFDTENHRMVALAGEVGCGKSSLLELISRFFDPSEGEIILDGVPLKKWDLRDLRKRIGYVSQEPLLFTDTVRNNISFGRDWIKEKKVLSSSEISRLTEEVNSFTDGFDTSIGLRGMTVSGGQKQRISIARALAGGPDILILDDATSHLDSETEAELWNNIYNAIPDMRIFVVSHRASTLEKADLILVLKEGKIVEQGHHQELLDKKGEYYRIYYHYHLQRRLLL